MFKLKKKKEEIIEETYDENTYEDYFEEPVDETPMDNNLNEQTNNTINNTNVSDDFNQINEENTMNNNFNNTDNGINNNFSNINSNFENTNQENETTNNNQQINTNEENISLYSQNDINSNSIKPKSTNIVRIISYFILLLLVILLAFWFITSRFSNQSTTNYNIRLNLTSLGLIKTRGISGNYQINYLISPNSNSAPKYKAIDESIVNINNKTSYITSLKTGETTIQVYAPNDNKNIKTSLKVYVVSKKVPITNFEVTDIQVKENENNIITIKPIPENTTEINFTYESSDPNVVEVNNDGIIKGLKKGNASITISNNNISKTIMVNVY